MKKSKPVIFAIVIGAIALTSCESKTGTGALVGGGVGAGAGALIGGGKGALIGGAVGVVGGAIVGHLLSEDEHKEVQKQNPRTAQRVERGEPLSVNDIISLHKSGLGDRKIMDLIDKTGSTYELSTSNVHRLERAGVSDRVINYMMTR
ncbi:MAG: hypothetical protein S4CHLAM37_01200 [Chlamydiia bacterium]|nr:hypothetical protein [Chlamydiia bacterium]